MIGVIVRLIGNMYPNKQKIILLKQLASDINILLGLKNKEKFLLLKNIYNSNENNKEIKNNFLFNLIKSYKLKNTSELLKFLSNLCASLEKEIDVCENITKLHIISAKKINNIDKNKILKFIERKITKGTARVKWAINDELLDGFVIKNNSMYLDCSLKGLLYDLDYFIKKQIVKNL